VAKVFVMDNGYDDPEVLLGLGAATQVVHCHDLTLHKMWNCGLTMAAEAAAGSPHNVLIVNDDVEVETAVCAKLEAALRAHDDHWAAYPNHHGAAVPPGGFVRTQSDKMAGQTIAGWCVMLRGEDGLRFDERFAWWYGDTDLERRIRHCGRFVVAVAAGARHLDPLRSTLEDPARLAQAEADEALFAAKWDVDPGSLWLAQWKPAA
jgi:GT2 family glycosyltransferase